jgi:hypothetical protein
MSEFPIAVVSVNTGTLPAVPLPVALASGQARLFENPIAGRQKTTSSFGLAMKRASLR